MEGILLLSHGELAKGMMNTCEMFFGDKIEQMDYMCFYAADNIDDFESKIGDRIKDLDTGDGVIIICDLFAGTPAHKTTKYVSDNIRVITGMNVSMVLEILGIRSQTDHIDLENLIMIGKEGIQIWNPANNSDNANGDFFQ